MDDAEVSDLEEFYVPTYPITFDKTGKYLIYTSPEDTGETTQLMGTSAFVASIPLYCMMRAIQRMSWWRIALWSVPSMYSIRLMRNTHVLTSRIVTSIYLKEDGETVVIETIMPSLALSR